MYPNFTLKLLIMDVLGILNGVGSGLGILGQSWDLYSSMSGLDYERARDMQDWLNQQQFIRQQQLSGQNQAWTRENMATQHNYNLSAMSQQMLYNDYLSSAGRNIIQQRLAGINPNAVNTAVSSVSAPSTAGLSGGSTMTSSSSTPSMDHYSGPSGADYAANIYRQQLAEKEGVLKDSQSDNTEADTANKRAQTLSLEKQSEYADLMNQMKVLESFGSFIEHVSKSKNLDADTKWLKDSFNSRLDALKKNIDKMDAEINHLNKTADAAEKQADVAQQQADTDREYKRRMAKVAEIKNALDDRMVKFNEAQLENILAELDASAYQKFMLGNYHFSQSASLADDIAEAQERVKYIEDLVANSMMINSAEANLAMNNAKIRDNERKLWLIDWAFAKGLSLFQAIANSSNFRMSPTQMRESAAKVAVDKAKSVGNIDSHVPGESKNTGAMSLDEYVRYKQSRGETPNSYIMDQFRKNQSNN